MVEQKATLDQILDQVNQLILAGNQPQPSGGAGVAPPLHASFQPVTSNPISGMLTQTKKNIDLDLTHKKTWEEIGVWPQIIKNVTSEPLLYSKPSKIQAYSIPIVNADRGANCIFQSMNGSGKTAAFGIPAIMAVDPKISDTQVLIVANSRELIRQTFQNLQLYAKDTGVTVSIGESGKVQPTHIVVASPGFFKKNMEGRGSSLNLEPVRLVCFDEVDELFNNQSTQEQIGHIFSNGFEKLKKQPQFILFSATISEDTLKNIQKYINKPIPTAYQVKKEAIKLKNVKQFKIKANEQQKRKFLDRFYGELGATQAMIFVNAKNTAEFLQDLLTNKMGRTACILTGNLRDDERDRIIDHFRQGSFPALISTNVLARGIDVPAVDIVINYDIPQLSDCGFRSPDCANYLHRIGRTGRFGTDGIALTFYNPEETRVIDETHFINAIEKEWETEIVELESFDQFKDIFKQMRPMLFA